jgi:S-(hydroxymethyl)glutathione dehydrogenase/alcohol dehydrogenase
VKAAVLESFEAPVRIAEVDIDEPAEDEILIRTSAAGVCHTDLGVQLGTRPVGLPLVLGHEAAGVVERVGGAATDFAPGDHVVTCSIAFCGACQWCLRGLPQHCEAKPRARAPHLKPRLSVGGQTINAFVGLGAFAEHMLVNERAAVRIPDEMPLDKAALLGCAVITGMGVVLNTAAVRAGQTVAVIGCGGVGLNVVQAARFTGAARIIAVDRIAAKLERARQFGATDVVDTSAVDAVATVIELTAGGVDHAFEVVGRPATIEQAFAMLRTRGTATVVGVPGLEDRISIPPIELLREKRLQGTNMGSSRFRLDVPLYCRLYLDGRIRLDELVSEYIRLDDVNATLAGMDTSSGARAIIRFDA